MAEGDAPVPGEDGLPGRRGAVLAKIKAGLRRDIGVPPAVQDDGGEVPFGVKPRHAEQALHLFAHLNFNVAVGGGEQLIAPHQGLRLQGQSRGEVGDIEGQHRGLGGVQGLGVPVYDHLPPQAGVPAEAAEPLGRGDP